MDDQPGATTRLPSGLRYALEFLWLLDEHFPRAPLHGAHSLTADVAPDGTPALRVTLAGYRTPDEDYPSFLVCGDSLDEGREAAVLTVKRVAREHCVLAGEPLHRGMR